MNETQILSPGLYEIPSDVYHSDPCAEPSLTQSGVKTLLEETPAHFRARHPRLTEWAIDRPTKEQDLGSVVHKLLLKRGSEIQVCDFDDWRKKDAQTQRDEARAAGKIPILTRTYAQSIEIAARAEAKLQSYFGAWPIGNSEIAAIWKRYTENGEIWCRGLLDHWSQPAATIVDLKTTGRCLSDLELPKKIAADGYDIQAAFYLSGIGKIFPELAGRAKFVFAFVEVEPPFETRIVTLPERWLHIAGLRIDTAAARFADCLAKNEWPGWPDGSELEPPTWHEKLWTEELEAATV